MSGNRKIATIADIVGITETYDEKSKTYTRRASLIMQNSIMLSKNERESLDASVLDYMDFDMKLAIKQELLKIIMGDIINEKHGCVEDFFVFCGKPVMFYVNPAVPNIDSVIVMVHPDKVLQLYELRYRQLSNIYIPTKK